jgi:copper ion binding protein
VAGVTAADVSFPRDEAIVRGSASLSDLVAAVEAVGFGAELAGPAAASAVAAASTPTAAAAALPVVLRIEGMMCQNSCGTTVANALRRVAGVTQADVSFPRDEAIVRGSASLSDLVAAVETVGFGAELAGPAAAAAALAALPAPPVVLRIEGMMCQNNCGTTVTNALLGVAGVTHADVSFPREEAIVRGSASLSDLVAAVETVGFGAELAGPAAASAAAASTATAPHRSATARGGLASRGGGVAGTAEESKDATSSSRPGDMQATFTVSGMTCSSCASAVEKCLKSGFPTVRRVNVAVLAERVEVSFCGGGSGNGAGGAGRAGGKGGGHGKYSDNAADDEDAGYTDDTNGDTRDPDALAAAMAKAMTRAGYPARLLRIMGGGGGAGGGGGHEGTKVILAVGGMSCASCVGKVERTLAELDGVVKVGVSLATERCTVWYDATVPGIGPRSFMGEITGLGFTVSPVNEEDRGDASLLQVTRRERERER